MAVDITIKYPDRSKKIYKIIWWQHRWISMIEGLMYNQFIVFDKVDEFFYDMYLEYDSVELVILIDKDKNEILKIHSLSPFDYTEEFRDDELTGDEKENIEKKTSSCEKKNKVIAITGEVASGKSSVLYILGHFGARFMSFDHLRQTLPDIDDKGTVQYIKEKIEEFRTYSSGGILFVEIPMPIVEDLQNENWWDELLLVHSSKQLRQQRREHLCCCEKDYSFVPSFVLFNNDDMEMLRRKIEMYWVNLCSKI